jgi:hypothetical protein
MEDIQPKEQEITACQEGGYFSSERFTKTCYDDAVLLALAKFPLKSLKDQLILNINNKVVKDGELTITKILQIILQTTALDISENNTNLMKQYYEYIHNNIVKLTD